MVMAIRGVRGAHPNAQVKEKLKDSEKLVRRRRYPTRLISPQ